LNVIYLIVASLTKMVCRYGPNSVTCRVT